MKIFMIKCRINCNITEEDAEIISDILIISDKRGLDSHRIGRLRPIYIDKTELGDP